MEALAGLNAHCTRQSPRGLPVHYVVPHPWPHLRGFFPDRRRPRRSDRTPAYWQHMAHPIQPRDLMVFDVHCLVVRYSVCDGPPLSSTFNFSALTGSPDRPPFNSVRFWVLNFFHKLRSQNKCNEYDSHHTTIQRTDAVVLNREIVLFQNIFSSSPYNSSIP